MEASTINTTANNHILIKYYQVHSRIYDATRWSFLFGRHAIVDAVAPLAKPNKILEVGCGTGKNLIALSRRFPHASITGIDLSTDMLKKAQSNLARQNLDVKLQHGAYGTIPHLSGFDLILFSYALTMFNPGWDEAITQAHRDLNPGGMIAVVDFNDSPLPSFKRWMGANHVRMDGQLTPRLSTLFTPHLNTVKQAYGGIWNYLLFIGQK